MADVGPQDDSAALKNARGNPNKPMDEAALIAAIDDADNRAYGSNLSNLTAELSAQRALAVDLYLGKNVDPAPEGQSNVIDRSVFETVQWILPSLCRIFANGDDVITIVPENEADVDGAKQESAYLNWQLTQKHPWFDLFLEWSTDALLTKNAYFLVYRDRNRRVEIERYESQTKEGVAYLLNDPQIELIDSRQYEAKDLPPEPVMDPQTGQPIMDANGQPMMRPAMLYDVMVRRTGDQKELCIRVLPPERVKVDQRAFSWRIDERCNYFEYWEETTLTELRDQGFDIPTDIADDPELYTQEDYARDQFGERRLERYKPSDPSMRRVKARMIWIRCDYDGDGKAELLQVVRVGRRILNLEEVSRIPVASGVACPLPHRHIGLSIADMVIDIQRIKTAILRQGLDNLYLSNNPQKVLNETAVNLEDVLISRPGGVIRTSDINQIRYEEHPFVFPQAVQGLEYLDEVRRSRTGINNNFAGVDSDQLNNIQPGTVSQLSTMAGERVVQIARILAFAIEDLASLVHEHVLKMGHKRQTLQISGKWVDVDPGEWRTRTAFKICVAFSAGNKDAQIGRLMTMLQKQTEAFQLGLPVVTPENYYNTLVELTKAADFGSPERFWTDPARMPPRAPPGPPPEIIKEQMITASHEKIKAAELVQKDIESQRRMVMEKYAIDANVGKSLLENEQGHQHNTDIETLKTSHEAILQSLGSRLDAADAAVNEAKKSAEDTKAAVTTQHVPVTEMRDALTGVLDHLKKTHALAHARKIVHKNDKGEVTHIEHVDHDGNVLKTQRPVRDSKGQITGLQ
jgi:hypothetical protein